MRNFLLALFAMLFIVAGCKKENTQGTASTFTINKSSLTLFLGYADTLKPTNQPASTSIIWKTSNDTVATVTNGIISAVGKGTAIITANIAGGSEMASCSVTVNDMSSVVGAGTGYTLLNDSTEQIALLVGDNGPYNVTITRFAFYSSKNVLISDQTINPAIVIPAQTTVITHSSFVANGDLYKYEPGDKTGVVEWRSVLYFDYNNKHYIAHISGEFDTFSVQ